MRKNIFGKIYDTAKGTAIVSLEENEIDHDLYLQKTTKEDRWFMLRTFYCGNQEICPLDPGFVKKWLRKHGLESKVNGYFVNG